MIYHTAGYVPAQAKEVTKFRWIFALLLTIPFPADAGLHPNKNFTRGKIRQQLQVLLDAGLLIHVGHGVWRLP
jgi:hypothetical protein